MTDYLAGLLIRTIEPTVAVRPRRIGRFEPAAPREGLTSTPRSAMHDTSDRADGEPAGPPVEARATITGPTPPPRVYGEPGAANTTALDPAPKQGTPYDRPDNMSNAQRDAPVPRVMARSASVAPVGQGGPEPEAAPPPPLNRTLHDHSSMKHRANLHRVSDMPAPAQQSQTGTDTEVDVARQPVSPAVSTTITADTGPDTVTDPVQSHSTANVPVVYVDHARIRQRDAVSQTPYGPEQTPGDATASASESARSREATQRGRPIQSAPVETDANMRRTAVIRPPNQQEAVPVRSHRAPATNQETRARATGVDPTGIVQPAASATEPATINVTIGRIEVRAVTPSTPPAKRRATPPIMDLNEYLSRRSNGGIR